MINGDLRLEGEGEDDTRAGRRMRSGEAREGNLDGNRSESSGRERHSCCEDQEEMQSELGQMFGAGSGTDIEGDSSKKLGRPTVLTPILGLVFRAALRPVSSTRSLLDGLSSYEPTCPKVRDAAAESGLCQEVFSKPVERPTCLGHILCASEEGHDGNDINLGEGDELREVTVQEDGHIPLNRYDDNRYV